MRTLVLLGVLIAAGGAAGCVDVPFRCTEDGQCLRGGVTGRCEPNHRCSFPDESCQSKRRYVADALGEGCVAPEPQCLIEGIAAGGGSTCVWSNLGRVSCWGDNERGQLGGGGTIPRSTGLRVDGLAQVVRVVVGAAHACALHADGAVSCWGDNGSQQLGGTTTATTRATPERVKTLPPVSGLSAGGRHNCARREDGELLCWGRNDRGQLGDGTVTTRGAPAPVPGVAHEVQAVEAGDAHTCALLADGAVSCWGYNRFGAVGPGADLHAMTPVRLSALPGVRRVSAGNNFTCVLAGEGGGLCWGLNDLGQLGGKAVGKMADPTPVDLSGAVELEAGGAHGCALLEGGAVTCWGSGGAGQLGQGALETAPPAPVPMMPDPWSQVATGERHTCALSGGEVYCWGRAGEGQLGDGTRLVWPVPEARAILPDRAISVATGAAHSCALTAGQRVHCWGRGDAGQLGQGRPVGSPSPLAVELPGMAVQVIAGEEFSCARLTDGSVYCWGRGTRGQLGNKAAADQPRPVQVALAPEMAVHIGAGDDHACAVVASGGVHCWGETATNRLGTGVTTAGVQNRPMPAAVGGRFVEVALGDAHTCARAEDGRVHCWGSSSVGQAGVGPTATPVVPAPVSGIEDVTSLVAGTDYTCALSTAGQGTVWCWGRGDAGQLGYGTTRATGVAQPVQVPKFNRLTGLSAGDRHTCALRDDGTAFCWGNNRWGQLGLAEGVRPSGPQPVANLTGLVLLDAGDRHTCAVGPDGAVWCWGSNQHGQLGNGLPVDRVRPYRIELSCP